MGYLDKAKASLADLQGDLSKATASLELGDKKDTPESSNAAPVDTPATSVDPSTAGAPKAKLPLAIRKNIMQVPPPSAFIRYVEGALSSLERHVDKTGEDGKTELNTLASSHTIVMDVTSKPGISYTGCEIVNGVLRILFVKGCLGTNVNDSLDNLTEPVSEAGTSKDDATLDFNARMGIKNDYEPNIDAIQTKFEKILDIPTFDIEPNFEHNNAASKAYTKDGKKGNSYVREWQKSLGRFTLEHFEAFVEVMENKGFGDDEIVQEGLKESVEKNQIALRIVDRLDKGHYNEPLIENGVLYIQTTAENWATNVRDPAYPLMDIL